MVRKTALILGCLGLVGTGCGIDEEVHQKTLDDLAACQKNLGTCTKDLDAAQERLSDLDQNLESATSEQKAAKTQLASVQKELQASVEELEELRKQRAAAEKRLASFKKLNDRLAKLVDTGKLKVAFRNGQMVLELPAEILFPSGRAKLSKRGKAALTEVAQILLEFKDRRFMIAGHTDSQKMRSKKFPNNWHLSTARAVSVLEFFITQGFSPENLGATGFGEFDPVASNDTPEGRTLNRRIEIILVPDLSELPNLVGADG